MQVPTCNPLSVSGKGLGSEASAFHREPVFYRAQSWGRGLLLTSARLRGSPTLPGVTHSVCFQIDQPTLGMPSREYYFKEGNNRKVSREPRGLCLIQMCTYTSQALGPLAMLSKPASVSTCGNVARH